MLPTGITNSLSSAVFSADCKLALTASYDNTSRFYEEATGKEFQVLSGHAALISKDVFSTDGKLALSESDDFILSIYEVATGKVLQDLTGHTDWLN